MTEREMLNNVTIEMLDSESLEIAQLIGIEAFRELVYYYSGTGRLYIPVMSNLTIPVRNALIRKEHAKGKKCAQLAREFRLTERYIQGIVREKDVDTFHKKGN